MPIYGNKFLCFILFELPIYVPLMVSFHQAPHSLTHPHQHYTIPPFHSTDNFTLLSDNPPDSWSYNTSQPSLPTSSLCHGHPSQYSHCISIQPPLPCHPHPHTYTLYPYFLHHHSSRTAWMNVRDITILPHIGNYLPSNAEHYRRHESSGNGMVQVIPQSL
jgi:hypothetical protein